MAAHEKSIWIDAKGGERQADGREVTDKLLSIDDDSLQALKKIISKMSIEKKIRVRTLNEMTGTWETYVKSFSLAPSSSLRFPDQ